MEIFTLLNANIRKKKSNFICIMLLTAIIVSAMTSIFSVRDHYSNALEKALEYSAAGDITAFAVSGELSNEICTNVENNELVEKVEYIPALCANGATVGESRDGNSYFMVELYEGIQLYNEKLDGFEEKIPKLQRGEIYLPLGLKSKLECNVGDTIKLDLISGYYKEFTIKGFVQEPSMGALTIGWKQVFISSEDFEWFRILCEPLETADVHFSCIMLKIYQAADSNLSAAKFQRQLNLETKIIDMTEGALNRESTIRYSTLMPDIVTDIVIAFIVFLCVIVLIVMSHSISTDIEIDYITLGILKSQGFSRGKIRLLIMLQYLSAQIAGMIVGMLMAISIEREISGICQAITAVLPERGLSMEKSLFCAAVILGASIMLILIRTRKVAEISPVRAISGGHEEIFFDSRFHVAISKKLLSASLSLRQFTSAKKRYIGTIFVAAILVFCMVSVNLTGNLLSSSKALKAMGLTISDIEVFNTGKSDLDCWDDVEKIIESHSAIKEKNGIISGYVSLNGENLYCEAYENPKYISGILKGRAPLYDNEILVTEIVADMLEIEMGDEVIVTLNNTEDTFIVSGIFQSGSDSGSVFAMNFNGAYRIGWYDGGAYRYYVIEDKSKTGMIAEEIKEKYGDTLGVNVYDEDNNPIMGEYDTIVAALKAIIYIFSILFAFVVVRMVCHKTFVQERRDIGIYKAIGFTTKRLRFHFGIRFFIIAVLGSILGSILSVLFSAKMLSAVLSLIGLTKVVLDYTLLSVLMPSVAVSLSFFLFAYLASAKIRQVEIKELVVE